MLDSGNRMEEGTRRANPMGVGARHWQRRSSPTLRFATRGLASCLNPLPPVTSLELDSVHRLLECKPPVFMVLTVHLSTCLQPVSLQA